MKQYFMVTILLLFIAGCSNSNDPYSPLSAEEQQKLQNYQLNNEFNNQCVSDKLNKINRDYCDQESHYCNIPPESSFNYQQWVGVYRACIVTEQDL